MTKINEPRPVFYPAYFLGLAIILALPILTISPWFFPADFGKTIIFRSVLALLSILFIWQLLYKKESLNIITLKKNISTLAFGALFFTYLLATIFSQDPYFSLWSSPWRGGGFITFASYFFLTILSVTLFKKEDWKKVWDFSFIIGILVSLVAVIQYYGLFSSIFLPIVSRPSSTMGNPILLGIYLLLLVFMALSYAITEKLLWKKTCYLSTVALFLYVILITGSRAAYLGTLAATIYFFLWYPIYHNQSAKKVIALKTAATLILCAVIGIVIYINTASALPVFLQNNRIAESITPRLLIKNFIEDSRFDALAVEFAMTKDRPLLGYGPENFSIGFDKHYNATPSLFGIVGWWDRAHNIIMQTLSDAGIFALLAYLTLLVTLFWQLYRIRKTRPEEALIPHTIGAIFLGYFIANLFSFDSFGSYLIFFLLIGYSFHFIFTNTSSDVQRLHFRNIERLINSWKAPIIGILVVFVTVFLWQYNIVPLSINKDINTARILINQKNCNGGLTLMENVLQRHSFLDSYARLEYLDFSRQCAIFYPENILAYKKRGLELITEAVKIQPSYTRYWIFMGTTTNDFASLETNPTIKTTLINQANFYLEKALTLAPKHQEITTEQARLAITAKDFGAAKKYAEHCIAITSEFRECYFYLGLVDIYTNNVSEGQKNIMFAGEKYGTESKQNLEQLGNAYGAIKGYVNLVIIYEKLITIDPANAQYHSSLAFFYQQLGRYKEARREALEVLLLSPESKPNVDAFLRTLPY